MTSIRPEPEAERALVPLVRDNLTAWRDGAARLYQQWQQVGLRSRSPWLPILTRYTAHVLVVLLVSAVALSSVFYVPAAGRAAPGAPDSAAPVVYAANGGSAQTGFLSPGALPYTIIPKRPRRGVIVYVVQPGESVPVIAERFEITPETIVWANGSLEKTPDLLVIGQELIILPISGVYHTVLQGDTIESIAKKYQVDPQVILDCAYNELEEPVVLQIGQKLIVPDGIKPYVPRAVYVYNGPIPETANKGTGTFGWPTSGWISQKYWSGHQAIDIAGYTGTPIKAADSGFVIKAGWSESGYGNHVIVDHGNGFKTLYAHFTSYVVNVGDSVKKGQVIGLMGSTGKSTGPHLHFEVIKNGVRRNPLEYLPY
ncbi:MAG: M23 family metallopeptidase [Chloroflexi bacterium]|nr:M23 family metallopeptidase [Chloroflexota bacterium]MBU1747978.1 M23 family metallopeptidase [Chloroflexota bacterium]MBU1879893.1 M23 family metallopeptidase [Chloroflexota bacterium]